jgi:hypothetical protein
MVTIHGVKEVKCEEKYIQYCQFLIKLLQNIINHGILLVSKFNIFDINTTVE